VAHWQADQQNATPTKPETRRRLGVLVVVIVMVGGLGRGGFLGEQVLVDVGHHAAAHDGGRGQVRQAKYRDGAGEIALLE